MVRSMIWDKSHEWCGWNDSTITSFQPPYSVTKFKSSEKINIPNIICSSFFTQHLTNTVSHSLHPSFTFIESILFSILKFQWLKTFHVIVNVYTVYSVYLLNNKTFEFGCSNIVMNLCFIIPYYFILWFISNLTPNHAIT